MSINIFGQKFADSPFDLAWTPIICKQFLELPIMSSHKLSVTGLWAMLTPKSRDAFRAEAPAKIRETFLRLAFHYAALAHPDTMEWPDPSQEDLLDECYIGVTPLWNLRYLTNGRRLTLAGSSSEKAWMTYLEFETKYGISVERHLKSVGRQMVADITNASRWAAREPNIYEVSFANRRKAGNKTIAAFDVSQVMAYVERQKQKVLTVDTFPSVFRHGAYIKGEAHACQPAT